MPRLRECGPHISRIERRRGSLVLLIVFMVAAPLMTSGIPVDLPKIPAKQLNDQKPPIVVGLDANGGFFVAAITASSAIISFYL